MLSVVVAALTIGSCVFLAWLRRPFAADMADAFAFLTAARDFWRGRKEEVRKRKILKQRED